MNRDDLFQFAAARGWVKGTPLTPAQKTAIRNALRNRLTMEDVLAARVVLDGTNRPMTAVEGADALLEELS